VPAGVKKNGVQARVGDLKYRGQPIVTGDQVAHAITMHLFAQALPGAPAQPERWIFRLIAEHGVSLSEKAPLSAA
jgi:hypothetical protein